MKNFLLDVLGGIAAFAILCASISVPPALAGGGAGEGYSFGECKDENGTCARGCSAGENAGCKASCERETQCNPANPNCLCVTRTDPLGCDCFPVE
jgi:hypothetical protein